MASTSQPVAYDAARAGSWWAQVLPVIFGLGGFSVYATYRAFEGAYYWAAPYLSPFYSPEVLGDAAHSCGRRGWVSAPDVWPVSEHRP